MFKMPVRRQQSSESSSTRSNEGFIFLCGKNANTVQTSWRPQLPLPKEVQINANENLEISKYNSNDDESISDMDRLHGKKDKDRERDRDSALNVSSQLSNVSGGSSNKKWSFGRLFRRKKEIETESSSEEDRKAGFLPSQKLRHGSSGSKTTKTKNVKSNRSSKLTGAGFDHIVVSPTGQQHPQKQQHNQQQLQSQQQPHHHHSHHLHHADNEFFLPVETISPHEPYYQNEQRTQPQQALQYLVNPGQQQPQLYSRSSNSLDRRSIRPTVQHKSRSTQRLPHGSTGAHSSSEEELISLHSSTFSKYRSDESIHSGGQVFNGASGGQSRRSRAARNERYYKRLSRDGEVSHGGVPIMYAPQPTQRWKTQPVPLSIYNGPLAPAPLPTTTTNLRQPHSQQITPSGQQRLQRHAGSLQHMAPYVQWGQMQQQQHHPQLQQQQQLPKNLQNSVSESKRSISYDSHIHLQNINGRMQTKPLPPPPPPRDPLRRVQMTGQGQSHGQLSNGSGNSTNDLRPLSYAFDQQGLPLQLSSGLNNRCVSDDKIWASPLPHHYQSAHSLNMPVNGKNAQQTPQTALSRRFITRAERDAHPGKKSLPNGLDFHYMADSTPRSRKPIHMLDKLQRDQLIEAQPASSGVVRTTKSGLPTPTSKDTGNAFWKSKDEAGQSGQRRGRDFERTPIAAALKPRSISSPRIGDTRGYTVPVYSEVYKPGSRKLDLPSTADNVICGSLHIKPGSDITNNYVEIRRHKDLDKSKSALNSNSEQRRSGEMIATPNKYDEYVAEKREQHHHKPIFNPPMPPQRKLSIPPEEAPVYFLRKKPANLEEAINELEAIYKSLGLTEPPEKKERVPTPNEFEKYALSRADDYDEEDSPAGEPDPVRDDVAYRNIQLANLHKKTADKQPPFGIPIGPIVPAPQSDYLHITPVMDKIENQEASPNAPDIVKDDLAVRTLRKDPPGPKEKFIYPTGTLQKKNRATRTQSANIYSLIQRDAAKPSGGDLHSYMELTRSIDRCGSMSDLHKDSTAIEDIPTTLTLLRSLRAQEQTSPTTSPVKTTQIPFRHPSQGGAICQLPEKLTSSSREEVYKQPVPLPRKSLTPEPNTSNHQMEDALNKIAKDAQESSVKLTKELQELRKEALITASRPKAANPEEEKLEKELKEIEAVSEAAKRCGKMLLDTLPDVHEDPAAVPKPRKLHKEGKLIKAIDQVSEAANAVCEKILKDIVTTEPPVVVHEAVKVKNKPQLEPLVMPNLIKKLDPIQSEKIEAIAKRCMRQISELADSPDYDNLANQDETQGVPMTEVASAVVPACNTNPNPKPHDLHMSSVAEVQSHQPQMVIRQKSKPPIEEIDQIMQECEAQVRSQQQRKATENPIDTALPAIHSGTEHDKSTASKATTSPAVATLTTSSSSSCNASNTGTAAQTTASSNAASSFSSSSDCLAKSSSPSVSRRLSSSITSFNPYSSSDYIKSPSSEYHAPSTDPIKTFSTTSYDVQSTSATPNITTNSTFSYSPSPPLNLTPVSGRARTAAAAATAAGTATAAAAASDVERNSAERSGRSSSPSQYNSSEELAMIFGIEEKPRSRKNQTTQHEQPQQQNQNQNKSLEGDVSGKVAANNGIPHPPNNPLSMSVSLLSPSNHASSSCVLLPAYEPIATAINLNIACYRCYASQNNKLQIEQATNPAAPTKPTTTHNNQNNNNTNINMNSPTNANPCSICSCPISPSSYKLETIPEQNAEHETHENRLRTPNTQTTDPSLKLSPNFNRIYASEISIIVDKQEMEMSDLADATQQKNSDPQLTECDSLISFEESSSNPDSGNVSLADYPLPMGGSNACVQLQTTSNSRFEIKNTYVNEVCIEHQKEERELEEEIQVAAETHSADIEDQEDLKETQLAAAEELDFPRLPTAKELADSLREVDSSPINSSVETVVQRAEEEPMRKRSIVYETPQLNMNISELRVNYEASLTDTSIEHGASESNDDLLTQIAECNTEIDKLSQVLKQLPKRRSTENEARLDRKLKERQATSCANKHIDNHNDKTGEANKPITPAAAASAAGAATTSVVHRRTITSNDDWSDGKCSNEKKSTTSINNGTVSLFGEARNINGNSTSLTTLEHVLMACFLGVITSNDMFTLFMIVIGILTIIAIVLC